MTRGLGKSSFEIYSRAKGRAVNYRQMIMLYYCVSAFFFAAGVRGTLDAWAGELGTRG